MTLPPPGPGYDSDNEAQTRTLIEQEDRRNLKTGRDVAVGSARLILTSPNGSRFSVVVSNAGALSTVAL